MTRKKQAEIVRGISNFIKNETLTQIRSGAVPADWDGHELRMLLSEKHKRSASMSILARYPKFPRARNFKNHMSISNL
jgi:hypothetical protein